MSNFIAGKNAVLQALHSERTLHRILLNRALKSDERVQEIQAIARQRNIPINWVDKRELDKVSGMESHQGILAYGRPFQYSEVEDILNVAAKREQAPFILMLDGLEDPYNFGSLIRSAVGAGVHGIIIPNSKQVEVNATVIKVSTGATEHMLIARVSNLAQTSEQLKKKGIWIVGTHKARSQPYQLLDGKMPLALIIGNEGKGMGRLLKESCDFLVHIPMANLAIDSLNASVAGAIVLFKIFEQRNPL